MSKEYLEINRTFTLVLRRKNQCKDIINLIISFWFNKKSYFKLKNNEMKAKGINKRLERTIKEQKHLEDVINQLNREINVSEYSNMCHLRKAMFGISSIEPSLRNYDISSLEKNKREKEIMKEKHREVNDIINNRKYKLRKIMSDIFVIIKIDMPWINSDYYLWNKSIFI